MCVEEALHLYKREKQQLSAPPEERCGKTIQPLSQTVSPSNSDCTFSEKNLFPQLSNESETSQRCWGQSVRHWESLHTRLIVSLSQSCNTQNSSRILPREEPGPGQLTEKTRICVRCKSTVNHFIFSYSMHILSFYVDFLFTWGAFPAIMGRNEALSPVLF